MYAIAPKILVVDDDQDIIEILRYNLNLNGYDVKSAFNGKEAIKKAKLFIPDIILPKKEFELFFLLAIKPGKVFTRYEIMNKVWGSNVIVGDRTIDVHIRKLREKIGDLYFKTVKGVGYKFVQ